MKTTERKNRMAPRQMELPLGRVSGGQIAGHRSRNRSRVPEHVANWWFARMREWTMEPVPKPEGRAAA